MSLCFTVSCIEASSVVPGISKNSDSNVLNLQFNTSVVVDAEFYFSQPSSIEQAELIEQAHGFRHKLQAPSVASSHKIVVLWTPAAGREVKFSLGGSLGVLSRGCALVQLDAFSFVTATWWQGLRRHSYKLSCEDGRPVISLLS